MPAVPSPPPSNPPPPPSDPPPPPSPKPDNRTGPAAVLGAASAAVLRPVRGLLALVTPNEQPLELQIVGRTLLHAALVGLGAGLMGCAFFAGAEALAEPAARAPRAATRRCAPAASACGARLVRPALPAVAPAAHPGARRAASAASITRLAPESRGGGGDATIDAFHHHDGVVRRRVLLGEGAGVDRDAGLRRLRRPRGADDADRRRARLDWSDATSGSPRASAAS